MLLKSAKLSSEVIVLSLRLSVNTSLVVYIFTGDKQSVFSLLKLGVSAFDLRSHVSVAAVLEINILAEVVVFSSSAFVIGTEVSVLSVEFTVQITDSLELTLTVFKGSLLGAEVSSAGINQTGSVVNTHLCATNFGIEMFLLVLLGVGFASFLVGQILKVGDFSPHFSTLNLDGFYITFKLLELGTEVSILVSLGNTLVSKTSSFEGLLIEHTSSTGGFLSQIDSLLGLIGKEELEVFQLFASFTDLISGVVESVAVFVFTTCSIISEHSVTTLHVEDLIVDTTVVSVLVSKVVKLLT